MRLVVLEMEMKVEDVLVAIAQGLEVDSGTVTLDSTTETIEDWDSLGHCSVLSALDDASDGKSADLIDLTQAASVEEIMNILRAGGILTE